MHHIAFHAAVGYCVLVQEFIILSVVAVSTTDRGCCAREDGHTLAIPALSPMSAMLTNTTAPAILANGSPPAMLTNTLAPAILTKGFLSAVLTNAAAPAILALVPLSSVLAYAAAHARQACGPLFCVGAKC
jgi:hypothetical protein